MSEQFLQDTQGTVALVFVAKTITHSPKKRGKTGWVEMKNGPEVENKARHGHPRAETTLLSQEDKTRKTQIEMVMPKQ